MGCDGGTIPKRDELVRTKKKPEQVCAHIHQLYVINLSNIIQVLSIQTY